MDWNDNAGRVSRAFDEWMLVQKDIRAFMRLGLRFSRKAYEDIWNELGAQPPANDSDELPDVFHREIEGLWPRDFEWMLRAAVVKDTVSAFEVYLERAVDEVREHHGLAPMRKDPERSPTWCELVDFFKRYLGVMVASTEVEQTRDLRHFLTHQRGELRTEKQRQEFQAPDDVIARYATLRDDDVERHLNTLDAEVRRIDPTVYRFSWGGERAEELLHGGRPA